MLIFSNKAKPFIIYKINNFDILKMIRSLLPHISCININHLNFKYLRECLDIKVVVMDIDDTLTLHN